MEWSKSIVSELMMSMPNLDTEDKFILISRLFLLISGIGNEIILSGYRLSSEDLDEKPFLRNVRKLLLSLC